MIGDVCLICSTHLESNTSMLLTRQHYWFFVWNPEFLSQSGKWQCCNHCLTKQYGQINLKDPVLVTFKLNFRDFL